MQFAVINKATGHIKQVKNLGWLLRNSHKVASLELLADKPREGYSSEGCLLIAQICERGVPTQEYRAECASFRVMHKWVRRPCLSHVVKYYRHPVNP